jgi:MoxR-like ATPase
MTANGTIANPGQDILRPPAEIDYAEELDYLESIDQHPRPTNWRLSPKMIRTFVLGSTPADKLPRPVSQKWFGSHVLVESALATLIGGERGILLLGEPGTGKSVLAELLTSAICRQSTLVVAGTAGTNISDLTYSWNIAAVIARGQSRETLIPSPIMTAMVEGKIGRVEEVTRMLGEVQDGLLGVLSERYISVPELNETIMARQGFGIIGTANDKDKGTNELSAALKRRFNAIRVPIVRDAAQEKRIIQARTTKVAQRLQAQIAVPPSMLDVLVQVFEALRKRNAEATSEDARLDATLSTADMIGVVSDAMVFGTHFGDGSVSGLGLGRSLIGTLVRRDEDAVVIEKFWGDVIARQANTAGGPWKDLLAGGQEMLRAR